MILWKVGFPCVSLVNDSPTSAKNAGLILLVGEDHRRNGDHSVSLGEPTGQRNLSHFKGHKKSWAWLSNKAQGEGGMHKSGVT